MKSTPSAVNFKRYLCLRRPFQQQHGAGNVIGEDHFIIHGHQPITGTNARTRGGAIGRYCRDHHLPALRREPEANAALAKPPIAGELRFLGRHVTAERIKMAKYRRKAGAQQRIPPGIPNRGGGKPGGFLELRQGFGG